jgi:hypothetical protein
MTLYNEEYRHSVPFHVNGINNSLTSERRFNVHRQQQAAFRPGLPAATEFCCGGVGIVSSYPTAHLTSPPCLSPDCEKTPNRRFARSVWSEARDPVGVRPESRRLPFLIRRLPHCRRDGPAV